MSPTQGRWIVVERSWHDTDIDHCLICGRLITRRAWSFTGPGGEVRACGPDCEELFETYWWPMYGKREVTNHDHHQG